MKNFRAILIGPLPLAALLVLPLTAGSAAGDQLAARQALTHAGAAVAGASAVTYLPAAEVAAAFAKGSVLLDGHGRNYMVHASRRDAAGLAEVHLRDTDIIYVIDGTAALVTGGSVVDAKATDADEMRGASIRDGATRQLGRDDVIVIPAGVPHWFSEVPSAFTYYVVKVR